MLWLIVAQAMPLLAVYPWIAYCDRKAERNLATVALRLCLAVGIGIGLSSCTYFLGLWFSDPRTRSFQCIEGLFFVLGGLIGMMLLRSASTDTDFTARHGFVANWRKAPRKPYVLTTLPEGWRTPLMIILGTTFLLAILGVVADYWLSPWGGWDAWAIWNQRARFLFRAGEHWQQAFSPVYAHTDYPLLLPNANARLWSYCGAEPSWTPWLLGCLWTFSLVGMLMAGVCRLRSPSQGILAGVSLLGMVSFLHCGASQYADIPLAFFIFASVLLMVLYDASEDDALKDASKDASKGASGGLLVLSGLAAGLAAWTKNEGQLFVLLLLTVRAVIVWRRDGIRQSGKELMGCFAGALPVLILVAQQKIFLATDNDLVSGFTWQALHEHLGDSKRYVQIGLGFLYYLVRIAGPYIVAIPLLYLFLGLSKTPAGKIRGLSTAASVLTLLMMSYSFVYLMTPHDLQWHLRTAMERLLLHGAPICLLMVFSCLATPEERLGEESTVKIWDKASLDADSTPEATTDIDGDLPTKAAA